MIKPIDRESLLDLRLADAMPARPVIAHVSTGVDEGLPSIPTHITVLGIGGCALAAVGLLLLLSAVVALPGRAK